MPRILLLFVFMIAGAGCPVEPPPGSLACPVGSFQASEGICECEPGTYGTLTLDSDTSTYQGVCLSGLEEALRTGNPVTLETEAEILEEAQAELVGIRSVSEELLRSIFVGEAVVYDPSGWSHHLLSARPEDTFILVEGSEAGHPLAAIGEHGGGRFAAFGGPVLSGLYEGELASFEGPFARLLSWLTMGDAALGAPEEAAVALAGFGWMQSSATTWLSARYPDWEVSTCLDPAALEACLAGSDLVIVGGEGDEGNRLYFEQAVSAVREAGTPVLFAHGAGAYTTEIGAAILANMGLAYGAYGGNYWSNDLASWSSVEEMLVGGGVVGSLSTLFGHFQAQDFDFDWAACTDYVGQVSCDEVPRFRAEFLNGAEAIKQTLAALDLGDQDLFELQGRRLSKLAVLLADFYRAEIEYPYSKTDEDITPFLRAYFADHAVHYRRAFNPAQSDLGSFSGPLGSDLVAAEPTLANISLSRYGGFTAVGAYAVPGEPFTVRVTGGDGRAVGIRINTQRTGSTREWNDGQYDRPKFLASPSMPLPDGTELTLVSPYGGTLQLTSDAADADLTVTVELTGVGRHPVLHQGGDPAEYLAELEATPFAFTEIANPYVQIHSRSDMMLDAIAAYGGDLEAFFADVDHYMVYDTYNLAGFVGQGLEALPEVLEACAQLGWDCSDPETHGRPAVQHINVDTYAHCGGGCSGNPYDQTWPLGPLGWGETHEIGHNLQRGRLNVYGWQSSEVSNQIFPLHKHWAWRNDTGESLSADRVDYRGMFALLQEAHGTSDPTEHVYQSIWSDESYAANNGQRMGLWQQMRHFADSLERFDSGWDIFTLMFLHERLFTAFVDDAAAWDMNASLLGFEGYPGASGIEGNDFLLISYSFLTEHDQRPLFDLWGVEYSGVAEDQIIGFGFPAVEREMWVSNDVNGPPHPVPVAIDGVSEWPLPEEG